MPLIDCPDCETQISSRSHACPKCGCPNQPSEGSEKKGMWDAVSKTRTPINVFALAMMAAASVFGASATQIEGDELTAFTYALHIFLAVAGMFFVCLLFCRSCIYPPEELARAKKNGFEVAQDRPILAAIFIAVMLIGYTLYQGFLYLYPQPTP